MKSNEKKKTLLGRGVVPRSMVVVALLALYRLRVLGIFEVVAIPAVAAPRESLVLSGFSFPFRKSRLTVVYL